MNPLIPMLTMSGNPKKEELTRAMQGLYDHGIRQVLLYPRSGCEIPYMSDAWRAACGTCIDFAAAHGMKIWLYDEFNWPSGSCGGRVTEGHPEFLAKRIRLTEDGYVLETASPGSAVYVGNEKRSLFCTDILNPAAVDRFIALTHEVYATWFGHLFGTTIAGIFSDEPSYIYYAKEGKEEGRAKHCTKKGTFPYYNGLFDDYRRRFGTDFRADITADPQALGARIFRLCGERFRTVFLGRIAAWCAAHGLVMTGHLLEDANPPGAVRCSGNPLKTLSAITMPGCDEIDNRQYPAGDLVFSLLGYRRKKGARDTMAELYALGPCSLPYARRRQMLWTAAAYGVNHYFVAVSHLSLDGNYIKRNYFHDFSASCPDFCGADALGEDAAEAAAYAEKVPFAEVSVRYPYSATLAGFSNGGDECCRRYFEGLLGELIAHEVPWELIDEDDAPDTPFCFSINRDGIAESRTGAIYVDAAEAVGHILPLVKRPVYVTDPDGAEVTDLLVRTYRDGSYLLVDRSMALHGERELLLHREGRATAIRMPASGVLTDRTAQPQDGRTTIPTGDLTALFPTDNVLRAAFFASPTFSFHCDTPTVVRLHIRQDVKAVTLDGQPLSSGAPDDLLPPSAAGMYGMTEGIPLSAGHHTLVCDGEDIAYLPAVILSGRFSVTGDRTIAARDHARPYADGETFFGHASVTFRATLPPDGPAVLTLNDTWQVTELYVDGVFAGRCAWAPYRFLIPAEYAGKTVSMELRFYSSWQPLFGDYTSDTAPFPYWGIPGRRERLRVHGLRLSAGPENA